ncbi:response regulator [Aquabacterium sp.]|uniref:response regulator n=1 Tax=Aquabacterium sp. TaxID=1872578 RepID=UPI0040378696
MTQTDPAFPVEAPDINPLRRKLLFAALAWTAAVVVVGILVGQSRIHAFRQAAVNNGNVRLSGLQDNVENHFRSLAALGQVLARETSFVDFLRQNIAPDTSASNKIDPKRLRDELTARPAVQKMSRQLNGIVQNFQIRQAYLQNAYGTTVADNSYLDPRYSTIGHNFHIRDYFIDAMETGAGFQFVMGRVSNKPGFNFSARIDDGARALGVLILKTDPASMARLFTDTAGRYLHIVDANGVIVAGNQAEALLQRVPGAPSLVGREKQMEGAYLGMPKPVNWKPIVIDSGKGTQAGVEIGRQRYLSLTRQLNGYPYTLWVLAPLAAEDTIQASTTVGAALAMALGWLVIWAYLRRMERQSAVEQARLETLDMTRALPLTLFRYRVAPDGRGKFAYIGSGVRQLFGLDEATLKANPGFAWGPDDKPQPHPPTEPVEFEVDAQQQRHWISVNSAVASTQDGGQVYDGYWLDVTARRQAELRFDAVFNHATSAFLFFHLEKGILRCNPATLSLYGADRFEQLQGLRPWLAPLSPARQPNGEASQALAEQLLESARDGNQAGRIEWRMCRLDGQAFDAEVMLLWLGYEDKDLYFAIVDDVTARKQTEEALRAASKAAQETTRAKSAFLANMSHEIRTPMNAIIGMTHLALDDAPPDKLRQYVIKAHQAANNLLQIINDVLDMSKIEAGHLELECIDFDLQDVLTHVSDVLGLPAERKGLELLFTAPPDLPARLMGDPTRLRQVLVNLGSNAIKFTDKGSVTIGLEIQHVNGQAIVLHGWVRDTGMGMSPDQQAKLFQPFSQVDASTTRRFGGTGLGLTISRQLTERMGGRLWVDSELHKGSTFHFTLRMSLPARSLPMALATEDWRGKHVLLVDDNADARQVLGQMASNLGLSVDFASAGEEALAHLQQADAPYDCIMLDWKMPGMDGVTCARRIHELVHERFPDENPCILLVTAFNRADAMKAAEDIPLADILTKPVTPSSLFDSLTRAMSHGAAPLQAVMPHPLERPKTQVPDLRGVKVLLVEDQPLNQELAKELLSRAGAEVTIAQDGYEALTQLQQNPTAFNCVLMDCQMPHMDGYTTTEHIRSDARWKHLPIIAMTASALVSDRERALAVGMNDHVPKPLDVNQMYQVISRWIQVAHRARIAP